MRGNESSFRLTTVIAGSRRTRPCVFTTSISISKNHIQKCIPVSLARSWPRLMSNAARSHASRQMLFARVSHWWIVHIVCRDQARTPGGMAAALPGARDGGHRRSRVCSCFVGGTCSAYSAPFHAHRCVQLHLISTWCAHARAEPVVDDFWVCPVCHARILRVCGAAVAARRPCRHSLLASV